MNGFPGLEALYDLISGTSIDVEPIIPEDFGTANLFLRDGKPLWLTGTQRVVLRRDGHGINLLVILVSYRREMKRIQDASIPETDNLKDARYVVLSREATDLECAAWTSDIPSAEVPLRVLEVLRIGHIAPGHIVFSQTQRLQKFISHY